MEYFLRGSDIFANNIKQYERACGLYKSVLDNSRRFCIDGHCKTIYMVEINFDGFNWGATPKIFSSEEEAQQEIEFLRQKYPFISKFRVISRKEKE